MKLYATITSERATEGQGGNDYINISLMDEKEVIFGSIVVLPGLFTYGSIHGNKFDFKLGDKPKDDKKCSICNEDIYGLVQVHHHNEKCKDCGYEIIATQE